MIGKENEKLLDEIIKELHRSTLAIPVLSEYKLIDEDLENALFIAVSPDQSIEQYLEDGQLEDDETFERRLNKVIQETQKSMVSNGLTNKELVYLGTIKNNPFEFKLFLQDNIKDNKYVRQINAYFIEPESRFFYEITLAAPPLDKEHANEFVVKNLYDRMRFITMNVKYNEKCPI